MNCNGDQPSVLPTKPLRNGTQIKDKHCWKRSCVDMTIEAPDATHIDASTPNQAENIYGSEHNSIEEVREEAVQYCSTPDREVGERADLDRY
ncbi:hypothetical protein K493DRAFT_311722, partial [Basidiobolus meristosporus CBS 931.73]